MKKMIILILSWSYLIGCTLQPESRSETMVLLKPIEPTTAQPIPQGPTDSGGGNGLKGKPLESFIVDLKKEELFKNSLFPKLEKIGAQHACLAGSLYHIATERKWFLVPTALEKIPSKIIGVTFETEQLAIHKMFEIWIDSRKFKNMKSQKDANEISDAEKLLWHELVMGVTVLKLHAGYDKCLARSARIMFENIEREEKEIFLKKERAHCFQTYLADSVFKKTNSNMKLDQEDYANIRRATDNLIEQYETMTSEDFEVIYQSLGIPDCK